MGKIHWSECNDRVQTTARQAYEAYAANASNLNYLGRPMPRWDDLDETIKSNWCAAVLTNSYIAALERELRKLGAFVADRRLSDFPLSGAMFPGEGAVDLMIRAFDAIVRSEAAHEAELYQLRSERDEWKRRALRHGCSGDGDPNCSG